jgi:hypothetical protein
MAQQRKGKKDRAPATRDLILTQNKYLYKQVMIENQSSQVFLTKPDYWITND